MVLFVLPTYSIVPEHVRAASTAQPGMATGPYPSSSWLKDLWYNSRAFSVRPGAGIWCPIGKPLVVTRHVFASLLLTPL